MVSPGAELMMLHAQRDGKGIGGPLTQPEVFTCDGVPAQVVDLRGILADDTTKFRQGCKTNWVVLLDDHR